MLTRARAARELLRLNVEKMWITNGRLRLRSRLGEMRG